ncbi:MAG: carboxypeptidase M32 [Phycisphaerales bacterium]|nr:carboxypeptidase M32 [Phycisphaerae bacterium]NNF41930.1 carboxypeptidase M32 [Phycisphaerales bacterium]NNM26396.1 carboxypeptidase M32 [Phycisphaerales bacterium]
MTPTTATSTRTAYDELVAISKETQLIGATAGLLSWDQEVNMPPEGVAYRSRQMSVLARLHHETFTAPRMGELLAECEGDGELMSDPLSVEAVNVRELRRLYDRQTRLPPALVAEEAELASLGQHIWAKARKDSEFARFAPTLEKIVELLRRKAECFGWAEGGEPWDALAEDYEPGCTAAGVEAVFTPLRTRLQAFLQEIAGAPKRPSNAFNERRLPVDKQEKFVRFVAESIGFDFQRGRLDVSTHPFCSSTHPCDVRLTTRFHEDNVNDALGSTMHEAGHGIYEQGLLGEHIGTPMCDAVSLGIHESQSRMWENQVGRSRTFWRWCHPKLADFFGKDVADLDLETVYQGVNIVTPDFIRVEADEATYNMHIMVRFEIERALMKGDLSVRELPGVWNGKYKEYLGLDVPDDARGCLQDVHWSSAAMGYFPTYTLGNLYCAQFFEKARADIPDLEEQFARGQFDDLRRWLNTHIHEQGGRYRPHELCEVVTGAPLSADPLMRHLEGKLRPLYGL